MTLKKKTYLLKLIECKKAGMIKNQRLMGASYPVRRWPYSLMFPGSRKQSCQFLIEEGYKINAVSGKGYCLISLSDSITKEESGAACTANTVICPFCL